MFLSGRAGSDDGMDGLRTSSIAYRIATGKRAERIGQTRPWMAPMRGPGMPKSDARTTDSALARPPPTRQAGRKGRLKFLYPDAMRCLARNHLARPGMRW